MIATSSNNPQTSTHKISAQGQFFSSKTGQGADGTSQK
jgi:hypothetical protein